MAKGKSRPWATTKWLKEHYVDKKMSTGAIAKTVHEVFGIKIYANTVRRELKKMGIPLRSRSAAQSSYLSQNEHPMKGRPRTEKEKEKISRGIQWAWETKDDEEVRKLKEAMSARAREKWDDMTDKEKERNLEKMRAANRKKSGMGSKNENAIADLLKEEGFQIAQRTKAYSPRRQFEIDIAIPSKAIAIEWDGAAHFLPIYGDDQLKKTMAKDERKNKALLSNNWTVIRCKDHSTSHSMAFCRRTVDKILKIIRGGKRGVVHYVEAE